MANDYLYLIMVNPGENNNKFYEMKDNGDGTFTSSWGRVEGHKAKKTYSMDLWDKTKRAKLKKGYMDRTTLHSIAVPQASGNAPTVQHGSSIVQSVFRVLQQAATGTVTKNYTASVQVVTQAMLDDAQGILNLLVGSIQGANWSGYNNHLVTLFHTIPRKMSRVQEYILDLSEEASVMNEKARQLLDNEQKLLDVMAGQVYIHKASDNSPTTDLLAQLGIVVKDVTPAQQKLILAKMGNYSSKYRQAIQLTDTHTQPAFDTMLSKSSDDTRDLLWHGSRNENWISIFKTGLVLHPTNAVISGKMFGYGLYFANRAQKSYGYCSARGSYWASGNQAQGYLALFDVHMGNSWHIKSWQNSYSQLKERQVRSKGYDSVFAHGGLDLRNDEIIVYNHQQCTVKYLVEVT